MDMLDTLRQEYEELDQIRTGINEEVRKAEGRIKNYEVLLEEENAVLSELLSDQARNDRRLNEIEEEIDELEVKQRIIDLSVDTAVELNNN